MLFNANVKFGSLISDIPTENTIRHLPQFFRADADYVYRLGGPFMRKVINEAPLKNKYNYISIDTRIHMLMPGWMPCIGGWHCDDFYRPSSKQPALERIISDRVYSEHHTLVVGPCAMTEFATTPIELNVPTEDQLSGRNLYAHFNSLIEERKDEIKTELIKSGQFVSFDSFDFHRGRSAEVSGWRLFVRITESNHWEPKNEIRTQTQVYLQDFGAGW